jgi:hypothetical protein
MPSRLPTRRAWFPSTEPTKRTWSPASTMRFVDSATRPASTTRCGIATVRRSAARECVRAASDSTGPAL